MSDSKQQPTRLLRPWDSPGKNTGVGCHFLLQCMKVKSESEVAQSCPTPSDPMDCSLPGSSVHGIFQARILEWVAMSFPIQESSPCLLHGQEDYLPLSHQGSWKGFQIHLKHWFSTSSNSDGETCSSYLETHWLLHFGVGNSVLASSE